MKGIHRKFLTFVGSVRGFFITISIFIVLSYFAAFRQISTTISTQTTSACPYGMYTLPNHLYTNTHAHTHIIITASDNIDIHNRRFESILTCNEPIDVVYTWVNGSDPIWLESYWKFKNPNQNNVTTNDKNRYRDSEELKYSLRSLEKHAPWIRRVYLVTDNQIPYWLDLNYERIKIVTHKELFPSSSDLPVFSSPAIEAHLHRIPELSNRFIYFNDDVFLGSPVFPDDFFTAQGQKVYLAWDVRYILMYIYISTQQHKTVKHKNKRSSLQVPRCDSSCIPHRLGDGTCDLDCNVSRCEFDLGDCLGNPTDIRTQTHSSSSARALECNSGCRPHWIGDNVCDQNCKTVDCAFDAPDCGMDMVFEAAENGSIASVKMLRKDLFLNNSTADDLLVAYVLRSLHAAYVDFKDVFSSVQSAKHNNENGIFASVLSENVLVVVYNDKENPKDSRLDTRFFINGVDKVTGSSLNISFVISRNETLTSSFSRTLVFETNTSSSSELESEEDVTQQQQHSTTSRRLLSDNTDGGGVDYYGDSLVHVNNIFIKDFGPSKEVKQVPAHTPLAINREKMTRLQKRYASEYRKTSSNRFRSSDDMQYAFAYFHWLIISSRELDFKIEQFFDDVVDTNRDGHLSENEMRTFFFSF